MIDVRKKIYNKLIGLRNVPELKDIQIYFWVVPKSVGDLDRFIVYYTASDDAVEADDKTYIRRHNWTVVYYSKDFGEDIADDLEELTGQVVSLTQSYVDQTANMMVHSYSLTL